MRILVINGPNLNMLGKRDKYHYGTLTLKDINKELKRRKKDNKITFFQSNYEGKIVSKIQKSLNYNAIILNLGAYTHQSIAIRDALELFDGIKVEVHLSDVYAREGFRKINYISDIVDKSFIGEKENSYYKALEYILNFKEN